MHVYMNQQLAADRIAERRADARRARDRRVRRARRPSKAGHAFARREWRVMVHALLAR